MGARKPFRPALIALLLLPPAALCLGALWQATPDAAGPPPAAAHVDAATLAPVFADAAAALRRGDCSAAHSAVAEAGRAGRADAASLPLVDGLYAHACDDPARAEVRLTRAAGTAGALEDWRLLVLAESAAARGHRTLARNALDRLLAEHPASPLRSRALEEAARLAWDDGGGEAARALELVERGRGEAAGSALDELAWEIGLAAGHRPAQETAARRLLVHHPLRAEELDVSALFRQPAATAGGDVEWAAVLTPGELLRRAERLLDAGRPEQAETALSAVPAARRDLEWRLLSARTLTARRDGLAALRLLDAATAATPAEAARLEWQRGLAASDAARVRRGRTPLPSAERQSLREAARRHLAAVAAQRDDRRLAARALERLFGELWDDDRIDEALVALRRLREIDPQDLHGARPLWQAGWEEFTARNASGAVGYWSELVSLYPESAYARNARYWAGRAHEELGNRQRAREIYAEIVTAATGDFYTRYARARLADRAQPEPPLSAPPSATAPLAEDRGIPWPDHPDFARARLLSDLGLDGLALAEVEAVRAAGGESEAAPARRRAGLALESLVLARQGDRRRSIGRIHDAFPALGGPLQATVPARALRLYYPLAHGDVIRRRAAARGLPAHLVFGMVRQESGFDADAVSRAGARGLMQLMPATSREVARDLGLPWAPQRLAEPEFNVTLGTAYFRDVLEMFDGDLELALAGYNGGPYRIKRLWRRAGAERDVFLEGLPVAESRLYLKRILLLADSYRQLYPDGTDPGSDVNPG